MNALATVTSVTSTPFGMPTASPAVSLTVSPKATSASVVVLPPGPKLNAAAPRTRLLAPSPPTTVTVSDPSPPVTDREPRSICPVVVKSRTLFPSPRATATAPVTTNGTVPSMRNVSAPPLKSALMDLTVPVSVTGSPGLALLISVPGSVGVRTALPALTRSVNPLSSSSPVIVRTPVAARDATSRAVGAIRPSRVCTVRTRRAGRVGRKEARTGPLQRRGRPTRGCEFGTRRMGLVVP